MEKNNINISKRLFIYYARKVFRKTNISYPPKRTGTCAYQRVKYVSFMENFVQVLNGYFLIKAMRLMPHPEFSCFSKRFIGDVTVEMGFKKNRYLYLQLRQFAHLLQCSF